MTLSTDLLLACAIVGAPFAGAALIAALRALDRATSVFALVALSTGTITALFVIALWAAVVRPVFRWTEWIGFSGIGLGLHVDDLSLLFAIMVSGVSLLSLLYSLRYIPHEMAVQGTSSGKAAYYGYMLFFTGSMLGMVFAGDLIQLYVFWEMTGLASFLLIGLNWRDPKARYGAMKALLITALGGVAMLVGFIALGSTVGTFSLPAVLEQSELLRTSPVFGVVLLLLVVGAASKSAQFPFHVWLPDAMAAPTPVSAFLHSAALVAAGVYLLARFHPIFADAFLWQWSVSGVGVASLLVGGILALKASEFKALLAYSTISQYGLIFFLLGTASAGALAAALFSFFQHGLIKAGLFFSAGAITYATGRSTLGENGGLWSRLPVVFVISATVALSLGGLPPFAGFWIKELFVGATLAASNLVLIALAIVAGGITLTYMLRFLTGAFIDGDPAPSRIEAIPVAMIVAPGVAALLTVIFGLAPHIANQALVEPAVKAVTGNTLSLPLTFHLDLKLLLSLLALGCGAIAFATYRRWVFFVGAVARPEWSLGRFYLGVSSGFLRVGQVCLGLQNGLLSSYIRFVLGGLLALVVFSALSLLDLLPLPILAGGSIPSHRGLIDWAMALLLLLVIGGTVLTFTVRHHLHVILALSAVGYVIAGVFALELAPDVGLVQVHVETLVTVLFVLALVLIPRPIRQRFVLDPRQRVTVWMVLLATIGGLGSAWLSWLAIEHVAADPIAPWFNENALSLTHAADVVAAILVDFRALDTLGEITVFAIAATGIYVLVRLIRKETQR